PGFAKPSSSNMVPGAGLEPAQLSLPPPQDGVSTSFTTRASFFTRVRGAHPRPRIRCWLQALHQREPVQLAHLPETIPEQPEYLPRQPLRRAAWQKLPAKNLSQKR